MKKIMPSFSPGHNKKKISFMNFMKKSAAIGIPSANHLTSSTSFVMLDQKIQSRINSMGG